MNIETAALTLWAEYRDMTWVTSIGAAGDRLIVYVHRMPKKAQLPVDWEGYRVEIKRMAPPRPLRA